MTSQTGQSEVENMMRLKVHKRVRFDIDPLLDRDSDDPDHESDDVDAGNQLINESEVVEEDLFDPSKKSGGSSVLTEHEFWEYVYSDVWSGRLRVGEGNLLRTMIRIFDELVVNRKLGAAESVQYHNAVHLRGRYNRNTLFSTPVQIIDTTDRKKFEKKLRDVRKPRYQTRNGAVKVVLTFYGGRAMGKRKRVAFDTKKTVDTSPRLTTLRPIMKENRLTQRRAAIVDSEKEREMIERTLHAKQLRFFEARIPSDFVARCVKAANDFIIVKECIVSSKDWKIRINITISRKLESRYGLYQYCTSLPRLYETKTMYIM